MFPGMCVDDVYQLLTSCCLYAWSRAKDGLRLLLLRNKGHY